MVWFMWAWNNDDALVLQYCKALYSAICHQLFWLLVNIGWSSDSCSCQHVFMCTLKSEKAAGLWLDNCIMLSASSSSSSWTSYSLRVCRWLLNNTYVEISFSVRLSVPYMSCTLVLECIANLSLYKLDELGFSVYPHSWCFPRPSFAASNNSLNCCSCI